MTLTSPDRLPEKNAAQVDQKILVPDALNSPAQLGHLPRALLSKYFFPGTRTNEIGGTPVPNQLHSATSKETNSSSAEVTGGRLENPLRGWLVTLTVGIIAAFTRFFQLSSPTDGGTPLFDEKHYVPQGWQMLTGGNWLEDNPAYGLVVHPPVGKWLLAMGEWMFGYTPIGWRIASALCGTIMVVVLMRITRRLTGSDVVAAIAGILLTVETVTFLQSRVGMLDIFQIFFALSAFSCIVADRDQMRDRLTRTLYEESQWGPRLGFRWWRFGAGVLLGLTCGTKWSGIYFVLALLLLSFGFDVMNRRNIGITKPIRAALLRDSIPATMSLAVLPVLIYLACFIPWFNSETSVYRHEVGRGVPTGGSWSWVPDAWQSLWFYEHGILKFHAGLTNSAGNHHPWESKPWTWPMSLRPVLYYWESGPEFCGANKCIKAIVLVGIPAMWWLALPLLLWMLWAMFVRRDWRYWVAGTGYAAAFLPWFANLDRQMYFFYATAFAPFLVLGIALCLGDILRWARAETTHNYFSLAERKIIAFTLVGLYLCLVIANFVWLWPILTGEAISTTHWQREMWLPSWH